MHTVTASLLLVSVCPMRKIICAEICKPWNLQIVRDVCATLVEYNANLVLVFAHCVNSEQCSRIRSHLAMDLCASCSKHLLVDKEAGTRNARVRIRILRLHQQMKAPLFAFQKIRHVGQEVGFRGSERLPIWLRQAQTEDWIHFVFADS